MRSTISIWLSATRPKTLWAAGAPVVIGTAMAYEAGSVHWWSAFSALVGAILIQIGTNFANDYFDHAKGSDTAERLGPTRATSAGLVTPAAMRLATILTFALVLIPGAYIIYRGGWPFAVIGLFSILCGVLYTGGPAPIGYIGLGDVFVLIFFGPVAVGGTYYLQDFTLTPPVILAGLATGLIAVALLTVNNLRDVEQDRKSGKRTLAVRFGPRFAQFEYMACLTLACVIIPIVLYAYANKLLMAMVGIVTMFFAMPGIRLVFTYEDPRQLNGVLARTGALLLAYSVLFAYGWMQ